MLPKIVDSPTCCASSLVGAMTTTIGPSPFSSFSCPLACREPGKRKPRVFPDPVAAMATMLSPHSATGQPWAWMGVGRA